MRPREVTDGSILLCFSDGEKGGPQAGGQEKEAGGGGESARLHPDLGGAGREPGPSAGLTSPLHVCLLHVAPQRGTPELEAPPSPLPVNREQQPRPRPAPPEPPGPGLGPKRQPDRGN